MQIHLIKRNLLCRAKDFLAPSSFLLFAPQETTSERAGEQIGCLKRARPAVLALDVDADSSRYPDFARCRWFRGEMRVPLEPGGLRKRAPQ